MAPALHHLTLNTGHVQASNREEVDDRVVDLLMPIVDAEGGPVPGMPGLSIDLRRPYDRPGGKRSRGAAFFQIDPPEAGRGSKVPVIMGMACWRADMQVQAWLQVQLIAGSLQGLLGKVAVPAEPPRVPWVAVAVLPWFTALRPEEQIAIGDLERCLFWAMVESE